MDVTKSLELQFLRADETASGTYGAYGTTALPATRTAGSGAQVIAFTTKQYYMLNGLNTKLVGYYPAATLAGGVVSWTFDGTKDILTAPKQEGSYKGAMPGFTFGHRLMQLQFYPYYSNAEAATVWGKVSAVKVLNQRTACTFTPASADATGAVAFTGAATSTLAVTGGSAMTPGLGTAAAAQFGQPVMLQPQESNYELTVTVTTEKGDLTMKVPARTYPAGVATKVYLKFTAYGLIGDAEFTDWATAEEQDADMGASGYVPCWYGDAFQNGGITTGLSGSITTSYNGYTSSVVGAKYGSTAAAYSGEKPYSQIEVSATDETLNGSDRMNWYNAWIACQNKVTDGGGWRVPRLSELKLIYNNMAALVAQPGFAAIAGKSYWSGTWHSYGGGTGYKWRFIMNSQEGAGADKGDGGMYVRCVREVPPTDLSAGGTANCYMVGRTGCTYSFDATKQGNGVNTDGSTLAAIAPKSAKVFWQTGKVIKDGSVALKDGRVYFNLDPDLRPTEGGSALIAVYASADGSGSPLWSWHIWATNYNPGGAVNYGLSADSKADVPGGQVHTYGTNYMTTNPGKAIMDRHLGAEKALYDLATGADDNWPTYGFIYQWGRKDPFPGAAKNVTGDNGATRPLYAADGTTDITSSAYTTGGGPVAVSVAVANPGRFYTNSSTSGWTTRNDNLWNSTGGKKTAYDPCPPGWRVVPNGTWSDFTGANLTNAGWTAADVKGGRFYTMGSVKVWYPTPGFRHYSSGALMSIGVEGSAWSYSVSGNYGVYLRFVTNDVQPSFARTRGYGFPVRCIQE